MVEGYTTEEQQVEALKAWWKKNGTLVIVGFAVLIAAVLGGQAWKKNQQQQAQLASADYTQVLQALRTGDQEVLQARAERLKTEHADTLYASLASLALAKAAVAKGELAEAQSALEWVVNHSDESYVQQVAKLRLAQVYFEQGQLDDALAQLQNEEAAFIAAFSELRGDIYLAKGDKQQAYNAYSNALDNTAASGQNLELLKMKRDDLASAAKSGSEKEEA